ncbi:MAG TPA: hypothetical protein VK939_07130 [Longimicrobiales bacterium]|nr:hypothetical protein [Longimicrobiales bacterium]
MNHSFTMTRAEVVNSDSAALKASIVSAAGSESGAESILRSIQRMGTDPSIEYFEMTRVSGHRKYGDISNATWRVRADRGAVEEPRG